MLEQVKILTSRRAYEFEADAIRLSMVSIQPIQQQIQQLFRFQSSVIGSPMATFGVVPLTYPPGIVFNLGAWVHQEKYIVPIRFLHFEQNPLSESPNVLLTTLRLPLDFHIRWILFFQNPYEGYLAKL